MERKKLRIGFVGVGFMGQAAHLRNYATLGDCEVVALAESREDLGRNVAARYGVPRVYPTAAALIASEKLDGIVASQQFRRHGIMIEQLLRAGVPIFIEKPLAASLAIAERLAAADKEAGGKVMVGYHKRCDPATIYAKAEIDRLKRTGELGKMKYVRMTMPPGDWIANGTFDTIFESQASAPMDMDSPDATLSVKDADSFLMFVNFYVHQVNLIRYLLGENYTLSYVDPSGVVIVGHGLNSGIPVTLETAPYSTTLDWQEVALVCFERGYVKICLPAPLALNRPGEVEVHSDPGTNVDETSTLAPYPIKFRNSESVSHTKGQWSASRTIIPKLPNDHAMRVQAASFLRFARGEAPPPCGAAEALEDIRIARTWLKLARGS
jgi:predicted dehydrogenase